MAKRRSSAEIGSDGEREALEILLEAFPGAFRVKRPDYGIKDADIVLNPEGTGLCEVKTGENYLSLGYQKHLDQLEGYMDTVRPSAEVGFVVVQDTPGRGRNRTEHVVFRGLRSFVDFVLWIRRERDARS